MSDRLVLATLRQQAWARAKGELDALLSAYYDEEDCAEAMEREVAQFIKNVEDNSFLM